MKYIPNNENKDMEININVSIKKEKLKMIFQIFNLNNKRLLIYYWKCEELENKIKNNIKIIW